MHAWRKKERRLEHDHSRGRESQIGAAQGKNLWLCELLSCCRRWTTLANEAAQPPPLESLAFRMPLLQIRSHSPMSYGSTAASGATFRCLRGDSCRSLAWGPP